MRSSRTVSDIFARFLCRDLYLLPDAPFFSMA
jgi:hypothetical protein